MSNEYLIAGQLSKLGREGKWEKKIISSGSGMHHLTPKKMCTNYVLIFLHPILMQNQEA